MVRKIKKIDLYFLFTSVFMAYFLTCIIEQITFLSILQKSFIILYFIVMFLLIFRFINKKIIFENIKYKKMILFFAIIVAFIFRNQFLPKIYHSTDVIISVLEQNDPASNGKEAWLTGIKINGNTQDLLYFVNKNEANSWIFQNGALLGDYTQDRNQLFLNFSKVRSIQLKFVKHAWSGVIEIATNNTKNIYNLYDPIGEELKIDVPVTYVEYPFFQRIVLLVGISFIIFYLLLIILSKEEFFSKNIKKEKKSDDLTKRYIGIDIIKTIAIFFVISVHFFLNTNFYTTSLAGEVMYLQLTARWLFFTCVPLFLLSTGYLQKEKVYNYKYWQVGGNILISYIGISIITFLYRTCFLKEEITIQEAIKGILNFSLNGYAWYVAMFVGLYLLIPAINLVYKNIRTKREKLNFIIILCFLTAIPVQGFLSNEWIAIYPITFYFIGAYIKEFNPKINKIKGIIWIILILLLEDLITIFISQNNENGVFSAIIIDRYGYFLNLCLSVIVFLLIYDIKKCNIVFSKFFTIIAKLTFEIYLFSYIFDSYFYLKFKELYFITQQDFSKYYFMIIPCVFFSSFISAKIYVIFKRLFMVKKYT
ncbi:MAG: acyltransferase family protein [Lachnospiraceae bacterium]|nr:acyltransferase family protein [Lachnospiraceae bacterium]